MSVSALEIGLLRMSSKILKIERGVQTGKRGSPRWQTCHLFVHLLDKNNSSEEKEAKLNGSYEFLKGQHGKDMEKKNLWFKFGYENSPSICWHFLNDNVQIVMFISYSSMIPAPEGVLPASFA